jgi:hypothetical protein
VTQRRTLVWWAFVSGIGLLPKPATAQFQKRAEVEEPPPQLLPSVRLGLAVAPTWAYCAGTDLACSRLAPLGTGLRAEAFSPLSDAIALGGRIVHARFGGTPSVSHVTTLEAGAQLHSDFDAPAGFFFGLSYANMISPGDAGCSGKPTVGLGVESGIRVRARQRLGLTFFASAIGSPFGGGCDEVSVYRLTPESGDPAAIGEIGMVGLGISFDVGKYR